MKSSGKRYLLLIVIVAALGILYYSIGRRQDEKTGTSLVSGSKAELMLYCGAGIRPAVSTLIRTFDKKSGIRINGNYAGSGQLLGQIRAIQKGDLFMPGAEFYVDLAIETGLADSSTKRVVAYFVPVIFVQKGNPKNIRSLTDLEQDGLRIGLGDERSCAVGKLTLKIFEKNNLDYNEIKRNVVYKSGTVNELGLAIQLGNVDAVILWDANARHFAKSGTVIPIPPEDNIVSVIPVVVLKTSQYPEEARMFIDFVTSQEGKKILREKGYTISPSKEAE